MKAKNKTWKQYVGVGINFLEHKKTINHTNRLNLTSSKLKLSPLQSVYLKDSPHMASDIDKGLFSTRAVTAGKCLKGTP